MSTARLFNGTSDYLTNTTTYLNGSAGPWTIMFWMKSASLVQNQRYLISNATGAGKWAVLYGYVNDGSGHDQTELYLNFRTGSQVTILDTNWHHVAYRYLGAANEFASFLDGVKTVINASLTQSIEVTSALYVGSAGGASNFYAGALAEVAFWSTNLTDANIAAIANVNGLTLPTNFPTGLLGYWPLGLASPDTDLSAANQPLTVNGTSITVGPYVGVLLGLPSSHTVPILTIQQW